MTDDESEDDLPDPTTFASIDESQVWSGFFASLVCGSMQGLRRDDELDYEVIAADADVMLAEYRKRKGAEE